MPPALYLYLRCHGCRRQAGGRRSPCAAVTNTAPPLLLPSLFPPPPSSPVIREEEPESVLGRERGARGSGLGVSIPLWTCQGWRCSLRKPGPRTSPVPSCPKPKPFSGRDPGIRLPRCPAAQPWGVQEENVSLGNQAAEVERSWTVAKTERSPGRGPAFSSGSGVDLPAGAGAYLSPEPFSARRLWESEFGACCTGVLVPDPVPQSPPNPEGRVAFAGGPRYWGGHC